MNKKHFNFFGVFILLTIVLSLYFVFATSYDLVTSSQTAKGGETVSLLTFNISSISGISGHNLTTINLTLTGNASIANITSVNISDGTTDYSNGSITGLTITIDATNLNASAQGNTNITINVTLSSSATFGVAFGLNISSVVTQANVTIDITTNSSLVTVTESNVPTANAVVRTSRTSDTITTDFASSKCSDGSAATSSGISTCVLSSSSGTVSGDKITGLTCSQTYDITVTATDKAGNAASEIASLSTYPCGSGSGGGGGFSQSKKASYSFSKITPGAAVIMKNFDAEIGVKEIKIEVNNEVQSVIITVTKSDGKPAAVTVEKSGKVYKYLEIQENNLADKLRKATVTLQVTKSWLSSNGLDANEIALFRFDENSKKWNELVTTYTGSEGSNEIYDVELTSFSFFAVGEREVVEAAEEGVGEKVRETITKTTEKAKNLLWLWIIIAIVVIATIVVRMKKGKQ